MKGEPRVRATGACEKESVHASWKLAIPEALPIPESDLCSILGNFVENALNAAKGLPEDKRWIEAVSEAVTSSALGVVVRNPYEGARRASLSYHIRLDIKEKKERIGKKGKDHRGAPCATKYSRRHSATGQASW